MEIKFSFYWSYPLLLFSGRNPTGNIKRLFGDLSAKKLSFHFFFSFWADLKYNCVLLGPFTEEKSITLSYLYNFSLYQTKCGFGDVQIQTRITNIGPLRTIMWLKVFQYKRQKGPSHNFLILQLGLRWNQWNVNKTGVQHIQRNLSWQAFTQRHNFFSFFFFSFFYYLFETWIL